ncbi:MAG TPA: NAD(P)H-hydrate epimerase, partial [Thermoanaerobaculia bacterium]
MKILTSEQMRNIDRRATEQFGIPSILLMENAALAVADVIGEHFPNIDRVSIFCGTGQNGGDGLALARHLECRGVIPTLFIIGDRAKIAGDAKANLLIVERLGVPIYDVADADALDHSLARASAADLVVDAIFGTGLSRAVEGLYADAIRGIETLRLPVVAVDIPSGLDASRSDVVEPVIRADVTVTFAQPKVAHIFEPSASYCGEIIVADISIPHSAIEAENVALTLVTPADVAPLFPARAASTHKGTYGHAAIVAGSAGKSGAAILAARGALRSGAGLVTIVTDRDTANVIDAASIESMTFPTELSTESMGEIREFLGTKSAVLVGPGLPDSDNAHRLIRELVSSIEQP